MARAGGLSAALPEFNTRTNRLTDEGDGIFSLTVNAKSLNHGQYYALCIDVDGTEGPQTFGDTGERMSRCGTPLPFRVRFTSGFTDLQCPRRPSSVLGWSTRKLGSYNALNTGGF